MMLLYPYRHSSDNGRELRHSIRSMVKHFRGISGVCIIGDKPDWYTGEYVQAEDIKARKEWSIVSKVMKSPHSRFLLCSDDVFARQDFDSAIPCYYNMPLKNIQRHGRYRERVNNTMKIWPDGFMFDIHTPMVVDRDRFIEAHNIDWEHKEYLCKSIYANGLSNHAQLEDCKIRMGGVIPNLPFFSTNDRTSKLVPLEEMYPISSEYESDI